MNELSVIVPNYNHAKYLPECIEAVLAQSFRPVEILIVDDGSTDNSIEVIEGFQKTHPQIRIIKNDKNYGVHYSFNKAVKIATGNLISAFAADDIIFPGLFEDSVKLFNECPELGLVYGDYSVFQDEKPYNFIVRKLLPYKQPKIFSPDELILLLRKTNFTIANNAAVFKKSYIEKYGGYDSSLLSLADYYLNAQICFRHPSAYIPRVLGGVRLLSTSYGSSIRYDFKKRYGLVKRLMDRIFKKEDADFRNNFIKSGYLSFNGYFLLMFLLINPLYWRYSFFIFYKVIKRKTGKN